ncbi:MAG: hypothetical protein ACOY90_20835 [Candidatus Zhuqueibacterota bacterium]
MKKILLIDRDQKFIGDLQTKFALSHEILATDNLKTAFKLMEKKNFDLLVARIPQSSNLPDHEKLIKMLKKLNSKKYVDIKKILLAPENANFQIHEYTHLGIAAIVFDMKNFHNMIVKI